MDLIINNLGKAILIVSAIALVIIAVKYRKNIITFILEVKVELSKVSWSTRNELIGSTSVVLVVTSIMTIFIGIVDLLLSKILSTVFKF
ncbi:preprotein translocase subunit SecE [bacterium]|nr:MAG: preprotein translocase subunit SecE [bacterium]